MPGLVGFLKRDAGNCSARLLKEMAQALEPEDRFQVDLYNNDMVGLGRVSLGIVNSEPQPIINEDETLFLFMEGEIFDSAGARQYLLERGYQFKVDNDAELILHLYDELGDDFVTKLNGAFVVAIWDARSRRLVLANDRLGLYPLYYAHVKGDLVFSSGVRALLADPALPQSVDLIAINQFLTFDHVLGDRTLLEAVRLLPQASVLTYQNGHLDIRSYWELNYPDHYGKYSEEEYIEQLLFYLRQAVERQSPNGHPAGLMLSGGLDSRVLLAFLAENSESDSFCTFTWGIPGCDDARFAKEISAKAKVRHHFFELKPDWLLHKAHEGVRLTDGLGNIVNLHALATLEAEADHADYIYKGFMGDALMGYGLRRQFWADYQEPTRCHVHFQVHADQGVITFDLNEQRRLFTDSFHRQVGQRVLETYHENMVKSATALMANQRLYFDITQRVPRMTLNGVEVVRSRAVVRLPFCDNDLVQFALTIPPGLQLERYLVKNAFSRTFLNLAKVPTTETGLPMISCARDVFIRLNRLIRWRLDRVGLNGQPERRGYKDYPN